MEFLYSQLKQKDVINLNDGKNMGRVCDLTVSFPEADFIGITVTGGKGFRLTKQDRVIPVNCIVKVGEDAILVKLDERENNPPPKPPKRPPKNNCPPPNNRPPQGNCPPPNNCPPKRPPVQPSPYDRRSYDEYE